MNVTVENLAPCRKLLRIEVEASVVDAAFEGMIHDFQKEARLPGFRPGKVPRHMILKTFAKELETEVKRKLISKHLRQALDDQKVHVVGQPEIEDIQFGKGQPFLFAATAETAPEFELPEYKGLPIKREARVVTDEDVERALQVLREQRAAFNDVARPVGEGDFVVIDYTATSEGQPLTAFAPTARGLTEKNDFWVEVRKDSFIPGFTEQLVGAQAGETRSVNVQFPADFVSRDLAGRSGVYTVLVKQVKQKTLPELDDAMAQGYGAPDVATLRQGVRDDLQAELTRKLKRSARDQIVRELLTRVKCDLPESIVLGETRNVVYDIVRENQERGVSRETIDQQKDQIFTAANSNAKDRVKTMFILGRIADKEGIKAEPKEVTQRILGLAEHHQIRPEKLVKQLQDRNGIAEIHEQILTGKVLDFLEANAVVEEVLPGAQV